MPRQRKPTGSSYGAGVPARPDQQMASQAIRQTPGQQPIQTATGGPYGQATQLADAQRAVPLPAAPGIPSPAPAAGGAGPAAPQNPMEAAMAAASAHPPPNIAPLSGPSQRPWEPSTTGLPTGPGPGPEALGQRVPPKASDTFLALFRQTGDQRYAAYAQQALARGQ